MSKHQQGKALKIHVCVCVCVGKQVLQDWLAVRMLECVTSWLKVWAQTALLSKKISSAASQSSVSCRLDDESEFIQMTDEVSDETRVQTFFNFFQSLHSSFTGFLWVGTGSVVQQRGVLPSVFDKTETPVRDYNHFDQPGLSASGSVRVQIKTEEQTVLMESTEE